MAGTGERIVTVETFPAQAGRPAVQVPVADGATLDGLMETLNVPGDTEAIIVNGVHVRPDYRLQDGDRVVIIPFMSGG